jgi:c-di-GMP-binding flagellar brake protein YcgR
MTSPPINSLLLVTATDVEGDLHSRVEDELEDGTVLIAQPSTDDGEDIPVISGSTLKLEWQLKSGIARQEASVARHVGVASLAVRLLGEPTFIQRRDYLRIGVMLTVFIDTEHGEEARGTTIDLSGGGMRALVPIELADDQLIDIAIVLPENEGEIRCKAHTIRKVGEDTYAFGFPDIREAERERVIRFVFARQQSMLRDGRLSA